MRGSNSPCSIERRFYRAVTVRPVIRCTSWRRVEVSIPHPSQEPTVFKAVRRAVCGTRLTWRYTMELNHCAISDTPSVFEADCLSVDGVYQTGGKQTNRRPLLAEPIAFQTMPNTCPVYFPNLWRRAERTMSNAVASIRLAIGADNLIG